jgi:hypothetical protein
MDGNAACLQCHKAYATDLTKHTRHAPSSTGSSCYNCHMPYTTYGLLKTLRSHQISSPSVATSVSTGRPNACNLCHLDKTLKWTANALEEMYGIPAPQLAEDERGIAASILWLLRGDAGQRAVVAQAMAWAPAQRASGRDWMAPFLAELLDESLRGAPIHRRSLAAIDAGLRGLRVRLYGAAGSASRDHPSGDADVASDGRSRQPSQSIELLPECGWRRDDGRGEPAHTEPRQSGGLLAGITRNSDGPSGPPYHAD